MSETVAETTEQPATKRSRLARLDPARALHRELEVLEAELQVLGRKLQKALERQLQAAKDGEAINAAMGEVEAAKERTRDALSRYAGAAVLPLAGLEAAVGEDGGETRSEVPGDEY